MIDATPEQRPSGLFVVTEQPEALVEFSPVRPMGICEELEAMGTGLRDWHNESDEVETQTALITRFNNLMSRCDTLCRRQVYCAVESIEERFGRDPRLTVIEEGDVAKFRTYIEDTVILLASYYDGELCETRPVKTLHQIITKRLELLLEQNPELDGIIPEITVGAYTALYEGSGASTGMAPNYKVALRAIARLLDASMDQKKNPDDPELGTRHLVVPRVPGKIQQKDVQNLYRHPDPLWQHELTLANTPKGEIFKPRSSDHFSSQD